MKIFTNTWQSIFYIFFLILFEFFPIMMKTFDSAIKTTKPFFSQNNSNIYNYINYFNILFYLRKHRQCDLVETNICYYNSSFVLCTLISTLLFYLTFLFFSIYENKGDLENPLLEKKLQNLSNKKSNCDSVLYIINKIYANLSENIICIFSICYFHIFFNSIFYCIRYFSTYKLEHKNFNYILIAQFILSIFFCFVFLFFYIYQITKLNVVINFSSKFKYHNDNLFSTNYRKLLLILKILSSIEDNLELLPINMIILNYFVNTVICFLMPIYLLIIFVTLLKNNYIFVINIKINIFKIFLIVFNCIAIFRFVLFNITLLEEIIILGLFISLLLSLVLTYLVYTKNMKNIINSKNLIGQLNYVLEIKQTFNEDELNNFLLKIQFSHKYSCILEVENCEICKENDFKFEALTSSYINQIKNNIKSDQLFYNKYDKQLFKFLKLIILDILKKENYIKIICNYKKLANKNNYLDLFYIYNLEVFVIELYLFANKNKLKYYNTYKILKSLCLTSDHLNNSFKHLSVFIGDHEFVYRKEFYQTAVLLYKMKNEIYKNLNFLKNINKVDNLLKSDSIFVILRYSYEYFFNTKLPEDISIINNIYNYDEDYLKYVDMNKNLIHIHYNLDNQSLIIKNIGRDFLDHKGKFLDSLFYDKYRKYGKRKFLTSIKNNKNASFIFEFLAKCSEGICNITLNCTIYPSLNFDNIMIGAFYEINKKDLIILEKSLVMYNNIDVKSNNNKLRFKITNFSNNIIKVFHFDQDFLCNVKNSVYLHRIFTLKNYKDYEIAKEADIFNNNNILELDYFKYKHYFNGLATQKHHSDIDPVLNKIDFFKKVEFREKLQFKISYLYTININILVCFLKAVKIKKPKKISSIANNRNDCQDINELILEYEEEMNLSTPTTSNLSSHNSSVFSNYLLKQKNSSIIRNSNFYFKKLNYLMISYSVALLIFGVYFLVIGNQDITKLAESFNVLNSYNKVERIFTNTITNFYKIVKIYDENSSINQEYNDNMTLFTRSLIKKEIEVNLNLFQSRILDFQKITENGMFHNYSDFMTLNYTRLSILGGVIIPIESSQLLVDTLKRILNHLTIVANNIDSLKIKIIKFNDDVFDISNIDINNLSIGQLQFYELVINYVKINISFKHITVTLNDVHYNLLISTQNHAFYLTLIFVGLHFILIPVIYIIFKSFVLHVQKSTNTVNELMNKNNLENIQLRLNNLKKINELFFENPYELFKKIKPLNVVIKLGSLIDKNDRFINYNLLDRYKYSINIKKLTGPLIKTIVLVFISYFSYSLLFYGFIIIGNYSLFNSTKHFESLTESNKEIFNILNLVHTIMLKNTTDQELYNSIYHTNGSSGYIMENSKEFIKNQIDILKWESLEYNNIIVEQRNLMNCSYLYKQINDSILYEVFQNFNDTTRGQVYTYSNLINLCQSFSLMETSEIMNIYSEYSYVISNVMMRYESMNKSYSNIVNLYNDKLLDNITDISLLILRPIQYYFTNSIMFDIIMQNLNFYFILLILYLGLNLLADIFIFAIIHLKMTKRIINIKYELENLIDILSPN